MRLAMVRMWLVCLTETAGAAGLSRDFMIEGLSRWLLGRMHDYNNLECYGGGMMNQNFAWMGGGLWMWTALGVLVVVVVVFRALSRK
jgi:hypothetical protein